MLAKVWRNWDLYTVLMKFHQEQLVRKCLAVCTNMSVVILKNAAIPLMCIMSTHTKYTAMYFLECYFNRQIQKQPNSHIIDYTNNSFII